MAVTDEVAALAELLDAKEDVQLRAQLLDETSGRVLLREGVLEEVMPDGSLVVRRAFLLSDMLLLVDDDKYRVQRVVLLSALKDVTLTTVRALRRLLSKGNHNNSNDDDDDGRDVFVVATVDGRGAVSQTIGFVPVNASTTAVEWKEQLEAAEEALEGETSRSKRLKHLRQATKLVKRLEGMAPRESGYLKQLVHTPITVQKSIEALGLALALEPVVNEEEERLDWAAAVRRLGGPKAIVKSVASVTKRQQEVPDENMARLYVYMKDGSLDSKVVGRSSIAVAYLLDWVTSYYNFQLLLPRRARLIRRNSIPVTGSAPGGPGSERLERRARRLSQQLEKREKQLEELTKFH